MKRKTTFSKKAEEREERERLAKLSKKKEAPVSKVKEVVKAPQQLGKKLKTKKK